MEELSAICQGHCWRQKTSASVCGHVVPATSGSFWLRRRIWRTLKWWWAPNEEIISLARVWDSLWPWDWLFAQRYTPANLVSKSAEDARAAVQMCNRLPIVANKCSRINVEEWQSGW